MPGPKHFHKWYCSHCGRFYATVTTSEASPEATRDSYQAKAGCCVDCPPDWLQSPGMTSFDRRHIPIHPELVVIAFTGELNHAERLIRG